MNPLVKVSLKYAVSCGVIMCISFLIELNVGVQPNINLVSGIFDALIFFLFIFLGAKEYKDYKNDGYLHFWQGLSIGMIIFLVTGVIFLVFQATYYSVSQGAFDQYISDLISYAESRRAFLVEQGMSNIDIENYLKELKQTTLSSLIFSSLKKKLIVGFFVTPVIAVLLRKQSK
jgi:hypothetical protein